MPNPQYAYFHLSFTLDANVLTAKVSTNKSTIITRKELKCIIVQIENYCHFLGKAYPVVLDFEDVPTISCAVHEYLSKPLIHCEVKRVLALGVYLPKTIRVLPMN